MNKKVSSESLVKDIRRKTRKKYSSEEKIRMNVRFGWRAQYPLEYNITVSIISNAIDTLHQLP